jgi:diguanylate cyclase (GGDEF)-like protein
MGVFNQKKLENMMAREAEEKKHTILVVDDEDANLRVLRSVLGSSYDLLEAADGQEAFELVQTIDNREKISLIISDQRMPRMTGVQFFEKIAPIMPKTIRIIVTGFVDVDAIIDSINKANIYKFILKPFDRRDLLLTVQRAIESYELQHKLDTYVKKLEEKVRLRTRELEEKNEALEMAYKSLEELSLTDPLTGLKNRRFLYKHLDADLAISRRDYENWNRGKLQHPPSVSDLVFFMVDMDRFKAVNDNYGHAAGDKVLIQIRQLLGEIFRESDFLVRWGGEEFLVVARFIKRSDAPLLAERIRKLISETVFDVGEGQTIQKTCSVGFACYPFLPSSPKLLTWPQVVDLADLALFTAKRSCRNAWVGIYVSDHARPENLFKRLLKSPEKMIEDDEIEIKTSIPNSKFLDWRTDEPE